MSKEKHGHWIMKFMDKSFQEFCYCSNCLRCSGQYTTGKWIKTPYCGLCGARMDEPEEDRRKEGYKEE